MCWLFWPGYWHYLGHHGRVAKLNIVWTACSWHRAGRSRHYIVATRRHRDIKTVTCRVTDNFLNLSSCREEHLSEISDNVKNKEEMMEHFRAMRQCRWAKQVFLSRIKGLQICRIVAKKLSRAYFWQLNSQVQLPLHSAKYVQNRAKEPVGLRHPSLLVPGPQ